MTEDNKELIERYPVRPGETMRLVISESMSELGESDLSLTIYGRHVPAYYVMGVLQQMIIMISSAAGEAESTYLSPETLYGDVDE
jgi:hypothetical protein